MARSNGNQDRTGTPSGRPTRAPQQPVDHGLPWHAEGAGNGAPANGYDAPAHGHYAGGPQAGQLPWPTQPPAAQGQQPYPPQQGYPQQHAYAPPAYPGPNGYPPQADAHHGHYFPAQPPAPADYPSQPYQNTNQAGYPYPTAPAYQDPGQLQLRGSYPEPGYGQPPGQPAPYPPAGYGQVPTGGHDSRGFDLGGYATLPPAGLPPAGPPPVGQAPSGYVDPVTGRPVAPPHAAYAQPQFGAAPHPDDAYADTAYGDETEHDEEEEEEEDEAPRGFGWMKIAASLVVAIAIGGGVAYGFKKYGSSLTAGTKPVIVRADTGPARTGPSSRSAVADDKAGERLGETMPAVVPATDQSGDSGAPAQARKVQTISIPPASGAPMRPTISVPGVALEGLPQAQAPAPAPIVPAALPPVTPAPLGRAVAPPPATPQRAPVAPKVIAAVEDPPVASRPAPPPRVPVVRAPKTNDAFSPAQGVGAATVAAATTARPAAPARPTAANGYIAVLASQGTAIDARKTLDDLQSKYGDVLGGKPTDVTEVTVNGKVYYRAIVGPPGSREAAASVCSQLKAAGHKDCFATGY